MDDFAGAGGWTSAGQSAVGRNTLNIVDASAGTLGVTIDQGSQVAGTGDSVKLSDSTDLGRFVGTDMVAMGLDSIGDGYRSGTQADLLAQMQAQGGASVEVIYHYLPPDSANVVGGAGDTITYGSYATDGDVNITVGASGVLLLTGALSARDVTITQGAGATVDAIGGMLTAIQALSLLGGVATIEPAAYCAVTDTRTSEVITVVPTAYSGPVALLQHELVRITAENLNVVPNSDNWFIRTGDGTDAIAAHGWTNVLDGGGGSNFLTGAASHDTFFFDLRDAVADVWSTVANFQFGDDVTLWGVIGEAAALNWVDGADAAGATGLTLQATMAGKPTGSLTLSGYDTTDLTRGTLATSFGVVDGNAYLNIRAI